MRPSCRAIANGLRVRLEGVQTLGSRGLWLFLVHGTDIGYELPYLVFGNASSPGRHSVRASLHDGVEEIGRLSTIDPFLLNQGRSDGATAIGMASGAVVPVIETLALGDVVGVPMGWI